MAQQTINNTNISPDSLTSAVTINAGVASGTNTTTTVAVAAGDRVSFKMYSASGTGTSTLPNVSVLYTA